MLFVTWICLFGAVMLMTAMARSTTLQDLPSLSTTASPCPTGDLWSQSAGRCCRVCAPGTGAIGACVATASSTQVNQDNVRNTHTPFTAVLSSKNNHLVNKSTTVINNLSNNSSETTIVDGCQLCAEGWTFSASHSHEEPCRTCSTCPKHARLVSPCNATHDTVCECEVGLFYLSARTGQCELCDLCPAGWGAMTSCGAGTGSNTVCHKCQNGTYSDVLSATAECRPCSVCTEGQRLLQTCTATQDTICLNKYMDIPPMYRFNGDDDRHDLDFARGHLNGDSANYDHGRDRSRAAVDEDDGGIDVIPLYCAALGAVVVGLLAYVVLVHYRRIRDKRIPREPHEDVEYSKASGADSGIFMDSDHHHQHHHHHHHYQHRYHCVVITGGTRLRDLPQTKKKELEITFLVGSRGPADWKSLARELGYNSGKIASFESRGGRDPGAPYRHVLHDWSRLEGATVSAFLRALRCIGRHDVVKFLQAECAEHLQPLTATLPQHVV